MHGLITSIVYKPRAHIIWKCRDAFGALDMMHGLGSAAAPLRAQRLCTSLWGRAHPFWHVCLSPWAPGQPDMGSSGLLQPLNGDETLRSCIRVFGRSIGLRGCMR